ncbi:uncharacterized protein PV06_11877 [Exophiala oligosperma]|uniref:Uncharacterized protein n=1 Tax=Exophiala oligosperma TaxID=215243 RepID=A0A0D2BE54_9EURO|nr:uncharacterized protein PV06_11877 [Exophiala oligosperma]KIW35782.1 hypothetical protein PV06_11877 [Exophiala oligosperma]
MESRFFRVQWSRLLWCPPTVTFKDTLYDSISRLGAFRPTPPPSAAIPIHDAINILVDIRRFSMLPTPYIDNVMNEAQMVAKQFTSQWKANQIMKSQTAEVSTIGATARTFWRVILSQLAGARAFSHYSADEIVISITPHDGQPINYTWDQVTQAYKKFSPTTPPDSPSEGSAYVEL